MSRTWFSKGLRGATATRIQTDLARLGFTAGTPERFVDGNFGDFTRTALQALQARRGLEPHGDVDVETWGALTTDPLPPMFSRCLDLTAAFEGHGFTLLQGNFDGAGLTWGIIGFTLKSNEIQALLHDAESVVPGTIAGALGPLADTWRDLVTRPIGEQIAFADQLSPPGNKTRLPDDWKAGFERLGNLPHVQALQLDRARERYFRPALASAERLNLVSELGIALAFDVHVQNGGFKQGAFDLAAQLGDSVSEPELRQRLARQVADSSAHEWHDVVLARKMTIATGEGTVNGGPFTLRAWGLDEFLAA